MRPPETHILQFYDSEDFLCTAAAEYLAGGVRRGEGVLMIATVSRREKILGEMQGMGVDPAPVLFVDAESLLDATAGPGAEDAGFLHEVGAALRAALDRTPLPARVYGEFADLLLSIGTVEKALQVEEFCNELLKARSFSITCAHSLKNFYEDSDGRVLHEICRRHGHANPAG